MQSADPSDLTPEQLVRLIGGPQCDVRVQNTVKELTDREVYGLLPQIIVAGNPQGLSPTLDYDGVGKIAQSEIRAALILAARVARARGIDLDDVPLSELGNMSEGCRISNQLEGRENAVCEVSPRR